MRRIALALIALLIGGVAATLGWQVAFAAPGQVDTLVVCQRPGADVRSPASNGTCPSGYTKTEITETPLTPPTPVTGYYDHGLWNGADLIAAGSRVVSLSLPPGQYALVADGDMDNNTGKAQCLLVYAGQPKPLDVIYLEHLPANTSAAHGSMSAVVEVAEGLPVYVRCDATGNNVQSAVHEWQLTATKLDVLVRQ